MEYYKSIGNNLQTVQLGTCKIFMMYFEIKKASSKIVCVARFHFSFDRKFPFTFKMPMLMYIRNIFLPLFF